ncbi:MAG TPA: hypothetical protein DCY31_08425 [Ruminococcaceae bacterium]|nr:hypothetical protein [Oscillospiraceae bacterium]
MPVNIKEKASTLCDDLRVYWKKPPMGRYMSFKEIVSLAVGGLGIQFVVFCAQNMIISIGNTLISNTIGIAPKPLYIIYILSVILSFPLTALRGKIIDSSRSKKGRYRPFILSMGLPTAILAIAFVYMPYERMSMLAKCLTVLLFNIGLQFFYMFYYDVDQSIINVLSPNTYERSDVTSIKSVVNSMAPTLGNIILPLVARAITGENTLVDIRIYRAFYPPMIIFGFILGLLVYFNTEEKIVQAKTHTVKIKFMDAFRAVVRNKYFWIISLAGWIGFLENAVQNIMDWLYSYQDACSPAEYSLIVTIRGNASLWPMLFIPFLIRALGKRKILVVSNIINVIFIILMLPIIRLGDPSQIIWPLMFCFFFNYMAAYAVTLLTPGVNGDIRDYQQYITGERIDGMFVAVGAIGSIVTLITNSALPELYDRSGLNEEVARSLGFDGSNVYEVLSDPWYFKNICSVLIIAATIGATLNVIPYCFYDLTEIKQKAMVTVLKIRALFEDYGNGVLSDASLVEAIDIIEEANLYYGKEIVKPTKDKIKAAKKIKNKDERKAAVKAAKQEYKDLKADNEKIEIARYVVKELNKFDTDAGKAQLAEAQKIYDSGLEGLYSLEIPSMKVAKALPKSTEDEKELRRNAINRVRMIKDSKKVLAKKYSDGIEKFDVKVFEQLFEKEDELDAQIKEAVNELRSAAKKKNKDAEKAANEKIKKLRKDREEIRKKIKSATDENSIYTRAAKPYIEAEKILRQRENYLHYEDIKAGYEESKMRHEEEIKRRKAEEEELRAKRREYAAKAKEQRRNKGGKNG